MLFRLRLLPFIDSVLFDPKTFFPLLVVRVDWSRERIFCLFVKPRKESKGTENCAKIIEISTNRFFVIFLDDKNERRLLNINHDNKNP